VVEVQNAQLDIQWLDIPVVEKSRYRLKALPDNKMVITFYGGQDGCTSALLSFENEKLKVAKKLPNDVDFCCMLSEKEAVFTNFYEAELYVMSYPSLKTLKKYHFSLIYHIFIILSILLIKAIN